MLLLANGTHPDNGLAVASLEAPLRSAAMETDSKHSGRTIR